MSWQASTILFWLAVPLCIIAVGAVLESQADETEERGDFWQWIHDHFGE
jgi:hypothetical protein